MVYSVKRFAHIKIYDRSNFLLVDSAENKIKTKRLRYQLRSERDGKEREPGNEVVEVFQYSFEDHIKWHQFFIHLREIHLIEQNSSCLLMAFFVFISLWLLYLRNFDSHVTCWQVTSYTLSNNGKSLLSPSSKCKFRLSYWSKSIITLIKIITTLIHSLIPSHSRDFGCDVIC